MTRARAQEWRILPVRHGGRLRQVFAASLALTMACSVCSIALSSPSQMSFGGRLTSASDGRPVEGPVTLRLEFFSAEFGGTALLSQPLDFNGVVLREGNFELTIPLDSWQGALRDSLWLQLSDVTHGITYPRQEISATAYALRIPFDEDRFAISPAGVLVLKETDPSVQSFARLPAPNCTNGEYLRGAGGEFECAPFALLEPGHHAHAGADLTSGTFAPSQIPPEISRMANEIDDVDMQGISSHCTSGDILKADGSGGFICSPDLDTDTNTVPNADNVAAAGTLMAGDFDGPGGFLRRSSSGFTLDTTTYLESESDPHAQGFAKSDLPTCAAGELLHGNGSALGCGVPPIDGNAGLLTLGTLPDSVLSLNVTRLGASISESEFQGISASCAAGKTLAADGAGGFVCQDDANTLPAESNLATAGAVVHSDFSGGSGLLRKDGIGTFSLSSQGFLHEEDDPSAAPFAKTSAPACAAGEFVSSTGSALVCESPAKTTDAGTFTTGTLPVARLPEDVSLLGPAIGDSEFHGTGAGCSAGQVLKADGSGGFSCQADEDTLPTSANVQAGGAIMDSDFPAGTGFLSVLGAGSYGLDTTSFLASESDPTAEAWAKTSLPACLPGGFLLSNGLMLSCGDPRAFTRANLFSAGTLPDARLSSNVTRLGSTISDVEFEGVGSPCSSSQVLKSDGSGGFACSADLDTPPTSASVEATGAIMDSDFSSEAGLLRKTGEGSYAVETSVYLTEEADPQARAFAKSALPGCGPGEGLVANGTGLSCVTIGIPIGSIFPFPAALTPPGYLPCDGSAVSRTTFAGLFAVIGTTFGAGNGTTTFNLPNLAGRVPLGAGTSPVSGLTRTVVGAAEGEETHVLSTGELPEHAHTATSGNAGGHGHTGTIATDGSHAHSASTNATDAHAHTATVDATPDHTHTGWTDTLGNHQHSVPREQTAQDGTGRAHALWGGTAGAALTDWGGNHAHNIATSTDGAHGHTFTSNTTVDHSHGMTVNADAGHAHTLTVNAAAAHSHTVTVNANGGDQAHTELQPFMVMGFFIKY